MTIEEIRAFFGWCTVVNLGLYMLSAILIIAIRGTLARIHGKMFHLDEAFISQTYYQLLGQYKLAILVLNFAPYLALKLMG